MQIYKKFTKKSIYLNFIFNFVKIINKMKQIDKINKAITGFENGTTKSRSSWVASKVKERNLRPYTQTYICQVFASPEKYRVTEKNKHIFELVRERLIWEQKNSK